MLRLVRLTRLRDEGVLDMGVAFDGVPMVYKNAMLVGPTYGRASAHRSSIGSAEWPDKKKGDSRAYDARTGKLMWAFHTVPQPGKWT